MSNSKLRGPCTLVYLGALLAGLMNAGCSGADGEGLPPDSAWGGAAGIGGTGGQVGGATASGGGGGATSAGATSGGLGGGGVTSGGGSAGVGNAGAAAQVRFVGRVDRSDPAGPRFAWSGTGVVTRFEGTSVSVSLKGRHHYTVLVDGELQPKLVSSDGVNALASGLPLGTHTVELYRRTEAHQGEGQFLGFDFGVGRPLAPPPAPTRRLEVIGDSITCGYGNEGADMSCSYTPDTQNHYLTYAAIAARDLEADLVTVAWSGKGVVCNYGDAADSCTNPLPTYYERALPERPDSRWDFTSYLPDAVIINLGTNDFSTDVDPDPARFDAGYEALLRLVRSKYPNAHILCTVAPLLSGADLQTAQARVESVIGKLKLEGDTKIETFTLGPITSAEGYGCDFHPSLATHQRMAGELTRVLESTLGW